MRLRSEALAALAVILLYGTLLTQRARGDDIILTDGRKITGTVVGMENGSFKVETDFGVALIRKDKVARIEVSKATANAPKAAEKAVEKPSEKPSPNATPLAPAGAPQPPAAVKIAPLAPRPNRIQERHPPSGHMEEHVDGITYFNDSFGFQMFKPPNWRPLPEAAVMIPTAVAGLGTEDEATVIVVCTVLFDGPASAYAGALESSLRKVYSDFEIQPEERMEVDGRPAIRRAFSGSGAGRVWHGMIVNLAENQVQYGLIGMTSDENYQFKSSVLGKIIASFRVK